MARIARYEARLREQGAADRRRHRDVKLPLLERAGDALDDGRTDDALQALAALIRASGGAASHGSMAAFDQLMDDGAPFDLRHTPPRAPAAPRPSALMRLGRAAPCPVDEWTESCLRLETGDTAELDERRTAGRQVAAPRRVAGVTAYEHHGLTLGDGRVVHFTGEPTRIESACVEVTAADAFVAGTPREEIVEYRPRTFDGRPLARLRPAIAAIRALSLLGGRGYSLLQWNCEHFAVWATLGVRHSAQVAAVRDGIARLANLSPDVLNAVTQANELLQADSPLAIERSPAMEGWDARVDGILTFDLGRAYWADDLELPVVYLPIWDRYGKPAAGLERPWTADRVDGNAAWLRNCPSTRLRSGWHASLVWIDGPGFWWLTSDGRWLTASDGVIDAIAGRLQASSDVLVTYLAGSYSVSKFLAMLDRLGLQDIVAELFARPSR